MNRRQTFLAVFFLLPASMRAQEVTLPLERYEELRARARPSREPAAVPPTPYALEATQMDIVVGKESARISQRLTLSIFTGDWVSISLPAATGSLTSTQFGTLEGRIKTDKGLALVVRGRGRHQVRLDSVAPLAEDKAAARSTRTMAIGLPAAGAVSGTLATGDDVEEVIITSGGLSRGSSTPHRLDFVGAPGGSLEVRFLGKGRVPERTRFPLKYRAVSSAVTEVARTRARIAARVTVEIMSGQLARLEIALPAGFDVVSVTPATLGWDVEGSRLLLTPPEPVEKALAVQINLTGEPQDAFASPLLVPHGAANLTLFTAVQVAADGYAEMTDPGSSRKAEMPDRALLVEDTRQTVAPFFVVRDSSRPPRWSVTWSEKAQVLAAQVDRLLVNTLVGTNGHAAYQFWAQVRSSGSSDITLKPPDGMEIISVSRDGTAVQPGTTERGLVVPLGAGTAAQVIHIAGLLSGVNIPAKGDFSIPLPAASVPIGRIETFVRLPGDRVYALLNPDRRGAVSGIPDTQSNKTPSATAGLGGLTVKPATAPRARFDWFERVPGYVGIEAAWSALATNPGPLAIRVKPSRENQEWF